MVNFWLNATDINFWRRLFQKWFLFIVLFGLYVPLICFIFLSFNEKSTKGTVPTVLGSFNGIQNYVEFFTTSLDSTNVGPSLVNSLIIAFISIPISLFIGLLTTVSIWKNYGKGQKYTFLFCNITISCPDIVQAIAFSFLFATLIVPLGINLGFFTVILTHIALQIPYVVIFLYPKLSKLNINLLRASYDLNFHFFESIIYVILPSLVSNILGAALLAFTISFDDYIITNLVRGGVNTISTELYSMKTGIKIWASVFGSLVIVGVTTIVLGFNCYQMFRNKNKENA
ncbi:ABC transporter permease [Candidatus Mycoplasma haematohominis]|uniref:Inner membrane ABC transporter permease protein YdcV n=1 Tax=Candidatus Mycoplasma haematohominis TaxID=1494318 RepID=A0A478FRU3_9MOLU|nr:polyamine ABC transporter permease [Candidatus Mycoplasma haemohominis]GCE63159.1 inner membrane ABC transporter permease protein YdcV [Candidatus Mycoplasma haemohominis]